MQIGIGKLVDGSGKVTAGLNTQITKRVKCKKELVNYMMDLKSDRWFEQISK